MSTQPIQDRVRAALGEIAGAAPAHPDPVSAMAPSRGPGPRSRWLAPSLAAAAVIVTILSVTSLPGTSPTVAGRESQASLPDRFPGFSFVQGTTDGRFGRAIALYTNGSGHEDLTFSQLILAGADEDRYRRLPVPGGQSTGWADTRLSPDGTKVAIGTDGVTIVDLLTGARTVHRIPAPGNGWVVPLAFSPDSGKLAYLVKTEVGESGGRLFVLDLTAGSSARIGDTGTVLTVAFSPDGRHLAVQVTGDSFITLVQFDGTPQRTVHLPPGVQLATGPVWSPDGRFLVTTGTQPPFSYTFVAVNPQDRVPGPIEAGGLVPAAWGEFVLGWRSPTAMLVSAGDLDGTTSNLIIEVDITNGSRHVLSRFTAGARDDLAIGGVQLATGLIGTATVRHSTDPDRGPCPAWAVITAVVCLTPFAFGVVFWLVRRAKAPKRA
jgi:WD40 repeat protein